MPTISSGFFVSTGENTVLSIRSDLDSLTVYNYTQAGLQNDSGVQFYWQRGMAAGTGITIQKSGGGDNIAMTTLLSNGFTLFDNSLYTVGNAVVTSASTDAAQPVVSTTDTAGLTTGSVVRLSLISAVPTICGIDFEISNVVTDTSFKVRWPLANAPGAAGGAGRYRIVPNEPIYDPRRRFVVNIESVGLTTVVTTSITHGYAFDEEVRMYVPSPANGMIEIDGVQAKILDVDLVNNTFTLDLDSSSFTTFTWPEAADSPYTPAQCMAFGAAAEDNETSLDDATNNTAIIGILLGGGDVSPAGSADDVIYWVAEKSDVVNQ